MIPCNCFHEGKRKVFEFSSEFGWNVVGWEKKIDQLGKKRSGGQKRSTPPLCTLFSLSRKETHFLARFRGRAYSSSRLPLCTLFSLAKKLTSSFALETVHIRQAGSCAIVVYAKATSSRQFTGSLSDILVRIIFRRPLRVLSFDKASSAAFCFSSCSRVYFFIAPLFTSDLQCSRSWDGWMVVVFGARNQLQELLLRAVVWVVVQCRAEHQLRE
jgi:hypothetical protein